MSAKDLHAKPFDESTKSKLSIFENYTQEWIPTFVMGKCSNLAIFDFFAGTGFDVQGCPGSPILILKKLCENCGIIFQNRTRIDLYLNEYDEKKYITLQSACSNYINESRDLNRMVEHNLLVLHFFNRDTSKLYPELLPIIRKEVSLVLLDQNGIKFLDDDILNPLFSMHQTDFLFFVASSYISRFANTEEFKKHLNFEIIKNEKEPSTFIHKHVLNALRNKVPENSSVKLYPFTIKKGRNIYGIIFGTSHLRGVDKFLKTAWKANSENGEANFDIYDENTDMIDLFEGAKLTKRQKFQSILHEKIMGGTIKNNKEAFVFALDSGMLGTHAAEEIKNMKKAGLISYSERQPSVNYESCFGKTKKLVKFEVNK